MTKQSSFVVQAQWSEGTEWQDVDEYGTAEGAWRAVDRHAVNFTCGYRVVMRTVEEVVLARTDIVTQVVLDRGRDE